MKTDTASRLGAIIARHYEIGELADYEQLRLGYVNISYAIETVVNGERKKYFLRRYKEGTKAEEIEFEHSIINHLVARHFDLVAQIIETRNGRTYVERLEQGKSAFYAVFDFLSGEDRYTWTTPTCTDAELRNAAVALAQFHNAVFDLSPVGKRYEPKILDLLPGIAENAERRASGAGETEFDKYLVENLDLMLQTVQRTWRAINEQQCKKMVQQVIHCDYHPGNLKFQNGQVVGLFDFDWSKVDARCFDVALAITYFCTVWEKGRDGDLQLDKTTTFLHAYQETLGDVQGVGPLTETELECLPHMIHASNLYVLNWTIVDFYGHEADPHEYLIYLKHGVRTMRWLEDRDNWNSLKNATRHGVCQEDQW